jgi:putative toxin-antitoxin system antitoxin component (TIGR02293 family)
VSFYGVAKATQRRKQAKAQGPDDLRRDVARRMRERGVLTLAAEPPLRRIDLVGAGLPAAALEQTAELLGVPKAALMKAAGIPVSTAGAQARAGKPLSPEASEKVLRIVRAAQRAQDVFGDAAEGRAWLTEVVPGLGDRRPLDLLATQDGYEIVMDELGRIVFGAPG